MDKKALMSTNIGAQKHEHEILISVDFNVIICNY